MVNIFAIIPLWIIVTFFIMRTLIFLSSPYFHHDEEIMQSRVIAVQRVAKNMLERGEIVLSPLIHNKSLTDMGLKKNDKFWYDYSCEMLMRCDQVSVLRIPGWYSSAGVNQEISTARSLDIPVKYTDPPESFILDLKLT